MTIKQILEYVLHTPHNTNPAVLTHMLEQLIKDNTNPVPPEDDEIDVVYDGGIED